MKDILFLYPLYYQPNSLKRFQNYLNEAVGDFSVDVFVCCTNQSISNEARTICNQFGFIFANRENIGGGEGGLWYLQKKSGINLNQYKYIWYFEESCEPVSSYWIQVILNYLNNGARLAGWDWHMKGKKRTNQIPHVYESNRNTCIAFENTKETGLDINSQPLQKIWDTPGYRHETIVFKTEDFCEFDFPDPYDPIWQLKSGWRSYGTRAERMWWSLEDSIIHGFNVPAPNLQWYVISQKNFIPPKENLFFGYFRELSHSEKTNPNYIKPASFLLRRGKLLKSWIFERSRNLFRKVSWSS
jgi:hypothetical protein